MLVGLRDKVVLIIVFIEVYISVCGRCEELMIYILIIPFPLHTAKICLINF